MKHFTQNPFSVLFVVVFASTTAFFQSCSKNNQVKPALSANIVDPAGSFPADSSGSYTRSSISTGLIAYWPLAGNAKDLSGNQNNGLLFGGNPDATDRMGNVGGAISFNNINSHIVINDTPALRLANTDFTINEWVNLTLFNSTNMSVIMNKFNGSGWVEGIWGHTGMRTKGTLFFGTGTFAGENRVLGQDNWYMVTTTYKLATKTVKTFVNGVLANTVTNISSPDAASTAQLFIGNTAKGDPNSYQGTLGDVRIYNRVISTNEINFLYAATTTPTANLMFYFPLSHTPNDISPNKFQGTLNDVYLATDRFGNTQGAYRFNGTTSGIVSNNAVDVDNHDFTLTAWVKFDDYPPTSLEPILNINSAIANHIGIEFGITHTGFTYFSTDRIGSQGNELISLKSWHMITCVYTNTGGHLAFYVDGKLNINGGGEPVLRPRKLPYT